MKLVDLNLAIEDLEHKLDELETSEASQEEQIELIKQTLEQLEGEREDKLLNVARWRKQMQVEVKEVIGAEIKRLQERKKSYERKVESLGEYLRWGLEQIDGRKIKSPMGTLYLQRNSQPSVEITDLTWLDQQFWIEYTNVPAGKYVELPEGNYRFEAQADGSVIIRKLSTQAIAEHYKETGEIPIGTKIEWGSHVAFR